MKTMSNYNNIYYQAEESILDEISKNNHFSFRTIFKILTASSIARKIG